MVNGTLLIGLWTYISHYCHCSFFFWGENIGIAIDIESKHQTLPLTLALIKHLKKNWHWHCDWKAFQAKHWHWHWHWEWYLQKTLALALTPKFAIAHVCWKPNFSHFCWEMTKYWVSKLTFLVQFDVPPTVLQNHHKRHIFCRYLDTQNFSSLSLVLLKLLHF